VKAAATNTKNTEPAKGISECEIGEATIS